MHVVYFSQHILYMHALTKKEKTDVNRSILFIQAMNRVMSSSLLNKVD